MAIKSILYAKKYSDLHKQIYFNYYMQMVIMSIFIEITSYYRKYL